LRAYIADFDPNNETGILSQPKDTQKTAGSLHKGDVFSAH